LGCDLALPSATVPATATATMAKAPSYDSAIATGTGGLYV
jgi:hypothetical protein